MSAQTGDRQDPTDGTEVVSDAAEAGEIRALATRGTAFDDRLRGLETAVAVARGHLDDAVLDEVDATVRRSVGRLRLSARHTVVGIAGATGSGKSSTYNALVGLELSSIGVRRPTTSWATAVVWGSEGADELLEWLGIPPRHQTMRDSLLDTHTEGNDLDGVVLMDLPDHDSTEVAHHLEVDRLVELADLLVWVVDPQKYADAALHDRYLKPLAGHQDVMVVVLNHIDTIPEDRRQAMVDDVRRLLAADGLDRVLVLPVSARQGLGMDALRTEIARRVSSKRASAARVEADITAASRKLAEAGGSAAPREIEGLAVDELRARVQSAAGVPVLEGAVERSIVSRARKATTWPPLALLTRSSRSELQAELGDSVALRGAVPQVTPVQRGSLHTAIRDFADNAGRELAPAWAGAVRRAGTGDLDETGPELDRRLAAVDLGVEKLPGWVNLFRVLQWALLLAAVASGAWWVLSAVGVLDAAPDLGGVPVPAVTLAGALLLGLVLAWVGRSMVGGAARRRSEEAGRAMREAVDGVLEERVVGPVRTATQDYVTFRSGVASALG